MPGFAIIDAHFHVYDPARLPYGWIRRLPGPLQAAHAIADFRRASGGVAVEQAICIEFLVDAGHHLAEAASIAALAAADPLVGAVVAHAPVEKGAAVADDLAALAAMPAVRGIRRILEPGRFAMAVEPGFVAGVRAVGEHGFVFEIGVHHSGLKFGIELARRCPGVTFVLDHLATPAIREGLREPWWSEIREFARLPNTLAKLSGVMADYRGAGAWRKSDIVPWLAHAIELFGCDRLMFGSDWPMFTATLSYPEWVDIVETAAAGLTETERRSLFRDTAIRIYRLAR
jgi:L-fuconolactonase